MKNNKQLKRTQILKRIILFLIRIKIGIKKNKKFRFVDQQQQGFYIINETGVYKNVWDNKQKRYISKKSNVKLNYLLAMDCKAKEID